MSIESIFGVLNHNFSLIQGVRSMFTCTKRFLFSNLRHLEFAEQNAQKLRICIGSWNAEHGKGNTGEKQLVQIS